MKTAFHAPLVQLMWMPINSVALVPETCLRSLPVVDGHHCTNVRVTLESVGAISKRFSQADLIATTGLQTIYWHSRVSVLAVKKTGKSHCRSHNSVLATLQQELQSIIKQPCHNTTVVSIAPRNAQESARQLCRWNTVSFEAHHCVHNTLGSCHFIVLIIFSHNLLISLYHLTKHPI